MYKLIEKLLFFDVNDQEFLFKYSLNNNKHIMFAGRLKHILCLKTNDM